LARVVLVLLRVVAGAAEPQPEPLVVAELDDVALARLSRVQCVEQERVAEAFEQRFEQPVVLQAAELTVCFLPTLPRLGQLALATANEHVQELVYLVG
jgi:hypothetical protein